MDSLQVSANTRGEFQRFNAKNNVSEINMDDLSLRGYTDMVMHSLTKKQFY